MINNYIQKIRNDYEKAKIRKKCLGEAINLWYSTKNHNVVVLPKKDGSTVPVYLERSKGEERLRRIHSALSDIRIKEAKRSGIIIQINHENSD